MLENPENSFFELTPDHILDSVENALNLTNSQNRPTGRVLALNSIENRVYDIECEGSLSLIAKFYRPGRWSEKQILEEHAFLKELELAEVPVVAPLHLKMTPVFRKNFSKSPTLGISSKNISFSVFPKFIGRSLDEFSREQFEVLGRYIARIHKVGREHRFSKRLRLDVETYAMKPLELLKVEGFLKGPTAERYESLVDLLVQKIQPMFVGFDTHLIHGDCHFGNLLWSQGIPHFVDFDDMVMAPPVQDFWMLMGGRDEVAYQNLQTMIESYEDFCDFDRASVSLIEPLRALRIIHYSGWIGKRWQDPSFQKMFPHFAQDLWWQNEIEALQGILEFLNEPILIA